jgi:hypothetical protein
MEQRVTPRVKASPEPPADPYTELEPAPAPTFETPKAKPRASKPLAPRAVAKPTRRHERARSDPSRDIALGIGGASLAVSALSISGNVESDSDGGYVVAGIARGIGVVGLTTAGILALTADDDEDDVARVRVRPTATGVALDF